ncbi:MAG: hypothetical protein K0U34_05410, partial [Alphaproteobacteria bacterium]|nr:hypothetical protein [Alphaproteobacteria bacterium]
MTTKYSADNCASTTSPIGGQKHIMALSNCQSSEVAVVLAAHGDRGGHGPEGANGALLRHAATLAANNRFRCVAYGVVKGTPTLEQALTQAISSKPRALVVYPFFMSNGYFVKTILPGRLAEFGTPLPTHTAEPLGRDPRLPDLMLHDAVKSAEAAGLRLSDTRL